MTKALVALVVLVAFAAIGAGTYVVLANRDPVAADTLDCLREAELPLARTSDALSVARADAIAGDLRVVRRWEGGRTDAVLLQGSSRRYAVLALWNEDTPALSRGNVGLVVYERPGRFPVVSVETPVSGRLVRCAERNVR